jgi:SAM-dependent methyltransferase
MIDELQALRQSIHHNLVTLDELIRRLEAPIKPTIIAPESAWPDLLDPEWPAAWPQHLISDCHTLQEKTYRAIQIASSYDIALLKDCRILDFGCGDGLVANELVKRGASAVCAYDIAPDKAWDGIDNSKITFITDLESVLVNAPYNTIILHDVIDHVPSSTLEPALKQILDVCANDVRLIITAHPFTSRHGGHVYDAKNLAYLQLLYSEDELASKQIRCPYNNRWSRPQAAYENVFKRLGLNIMRKEVDVDQLEPWIVNRLLPIIVKRIYDNQISTDQAEKILSVSWVQYLLGTGAKNE